METLHSLFPTADDLLAMPSEDLAPILLKLARNHMQIVQPNQGMFIPNAVTETGSSANPFQNNAYPHHKRQEVDILYSLRRITRFNE